MRFVVALVAAAWASYAQADNHYGRGLLPRPKDAARTFYQPAKMALEALPDAYDSRSETDCIPAVRNQGSCGSCWSFATLGAFETALCMAGKPPTDLAEQDALVNDSSAYGCDGGFMDGTFLTREGSTTEPLCPYRGNDNVACRGAKHAKATRWALIGGSSRAPTVDELKAGIIQYGSLFVTVAAGGGFSPRGERITTCSSTAVNHMVQLVGYRPAAEGGVEFLIKNSWGTNWGNGGYAWSKQGCNKLASTRGDAAGFFYVEPEDDPEEPEPTPAKIEGLAEEYVAAKGNPVMVQAKPQAGHKYRWSVGGGPTLTGARITVQTTTGTTAVLKVTSPDGAVTEKTVKISTK
jgi:hypothetical protein